VRWRGLDGTSGERPLSELTVQERMALLTEGPRGLEPLWLWLNEQGMPFGVHSWEGVFRAANERCERRDFRQLYGDPWFMVQQLLGHSSRDTTVDR
jgi:hypothetical protein